MFRGRMNKKSLPNCFAAASAASILLLSACGGAKSDRVASGDETNAGLLAPASQLQQWQAEIDQFGGGLRPTGSTAEAGYIDHLTAQLKAMGIKTTQEPYTFTRWIPKSASLALTSGVTTTTVPIASYIPQAGITGPTALDAQVIYLPGLNSVDATAILADALHKQDAAGGLAQLQLQLASLTSQFSTGLTSLTSVLSTQDVKGKIVLFDVPRPAIPIGVLTSIALHVNDRNGTMGPTTPYARPFLDMLFVPGIMSALQAAGAAGAIGILDYPMEAARGTFHPFFLPAETWSAVPGVYVDRDTGAALKKQLSAAPMQASLMVDAIKDAGTSHNIIAVLPGASPLEILVSSHTDGTNSIEDNGPAALLAIADYFSRIPQSQRARSLRFVFTGGHFAASAGIHAYCQAHLADLLPTVLAAIEIEHIGAREWLELSPGTMGLTGLNEPQVIISPVTPAFISETTRFSDQFDRSFVLPLAFPFGEGQSYREIAQLPLIQYITGPVYLLNYGIPEVTSQYTDYDLAYRQVVQFIQMITNLSGQPAQSLRPELAAAG
jgi:hypothetical protein